MIERITTDNTPTGTVGRVLVLTVESGKVFSLPIEDANDGDGVFSTWIRTDIGDSGKSIWINFCGVSSSVQITNEWHRVIIKGTIDHTKPVMIYSLDDGAVFYIHKAQLESGTLPSDWGQNNEEFIAGSSLSLTKERVYIATPLFEVDINSDGEGGDSDEGLKIDKTGGEFGTLTVTKVLTSPNVAYRSDGGTYSVGSTGGFDVILQSVNNRMLYGDLTITLTDDVYESIDIYGVYGNGKIVINGGGHTLNGSISLTNIGANVVVRNIVVQSNGTYALSADNVCFLTLEKGTGQCEFNGGNGAGSVCIALTNGTKVKMDGVEVYHTSPLIEVTNGCDVTAHNISGAKNSPVGASDVCVYGRDSVIKWETKRPAGNVEIDSTCLCAPSDISGIAVDGGDIPVQPSETVKTKTFNATSWSTLYVGSQWVNTSPIYQGYYGDQSKRHRVACVWFDLSEIVGKTIKNAKIAVKRLSAGTAGDVKLDLYSAAMTYPPSGRTKPAETLISNLGQISVGGTNDAPIEFTLPSTGFNTISSVASNGYALAFDPNDPAREKYSSNYAKFDATQISLTVTYVQ